MSKLNTARRVFKTHFRQSTILDPRIVDKNTRDVPPGKRRMPEILSRQDFVEVPTIATRGTWPMVHMIDEDTFVQMAIAAQHIAPDARARYAHSRGN